MHDLLQWLRAESESTSAHAVELAAIFHHTFTQIHPFDDGNGRMARILMNLILMQRGYIPVIIKTERRDQYFAALARADAGEQAEFVSLISEEELHSEQLFLRGAQGEDIADFDDVDKRIALLKQELRHIEEPAELTIAVQKEFFTRFFMPFLDRVIRKLGQIDELYRRQGVYARGMARRGNSQHGWPGADGVKNVIKALNEAIDNILFSELSISFQWDGFKKAGLNAFSDSCSVNLFFGEYNYTIKAEGYVYKNVYQVLPPEDEMLKLVNSLAERRFARITTELKNRES